MSDELRDQVAEAIHTADCGCDDQVGNGRDDDYYNDLTAAVLAVVEPRLRKAREAATEAMVEAEQSEAALKILRSEIDERARKALIAEAEAERLRTLTGHLHKRVERAEALLRDLVDGEDCWFDHHGGCQAHGYLSLQPGEKCPQAEAKELLAGLNPAGGSEETKEDPKPEHQSVSEALGFYPQASDPAPLPPDPGPDPYGEPEITTAPIRGDQL